MRCGFRIGFAFALGLALMAGCSDENGGGTGGTGGTDLCEGVTCDAECKIDGVCNPSDATCEYGGFAENGTACSEGECLDGVCAPIGAFPCTEQGLRDAIAEGGGPHFFACDGPTTVLIEAEIVIDNDVILDGEGNLTVDGNDEALSSFEHRRVFSVATDITAELQGFTVSGGDSHPLDGGGIYNEGTLMLTNSTVSDNVQHGDADADG
jgi:hypothetical protein